MFSYPLYLIGGVIAAFYLERFHDWVVRHWRGLLVAWTAVSARSRSCSTLRNDTAASAQACSCRAATPSPPSVIPYDVGAIVAVYLLGVYLVSPKRSARTRAIVASGSEAAYGIYVSQLLWILWLHRWAKHFNLLGIGAVARA